MSVAGDVSVAGNTVLTNANILGTVSIASASGTSLTVAGNAIVTGNLTVQGNLISVNTNNLNVANAIVGIGRLANNQPLVTNDGMDRGEQLWYYNTQEDSAFIGWQNSSGNILLASNVDIANNIVTVNNYGTVQSGDIIAAGNVTANYLIGNLVTPISQIVNGTSNVVVAANGNVTVGVGGNSNVEISTLGISVIGNITANGAGGIGGTILANVIQAPKQIINSTTAHGTGNTYVASNINVVGAKLVITAQAYSGGTGTQMAEVLVARDGTNNAANVAVTTYALINTNSAALPNIGITGNLQANVLTVNLNSSSGGIAYYWTYSVTEFVRS